MPTPIPPTSYRDFSAGMVNEVANALLSANAVRRAVNVNFDVIGRVTQRNGTTQVGNDVSTGSPALGAFNFVNSAGSVNELIIGADTSVYRFADPAWGSIRAGLTASRKQRFAQFIDLVFMVNGADALATWNGTDPTFGSAQTTDAPVASFIETFKNRVYLGNLAGAQDRIRFSSINTADTITWPSANFIDINRKDGGNITGLKRNNNVLLIFKDNGFYRWDGRSVDADLVTDVGCSSQESIVNAKGFTFYFNPNGIYATQGGYPIEISRPVDRWIRGMSASFYDDANGWADRDHVYEFIGDTTVEGTTYTNVCLVYTISKKSWSAYSFRDSFRVFTNRRNADSTITVVGGDSAGRAQTMLSGNNDRGGAITYELETKEFEFDARGTTKTINDITAYATTANGAHFGVRIDNSTTVRSLGQLTATIKRFLSLDVTGHFFSFKIWGSNTGTPIEFDGFDITNSNTQGFIDA